MRDIRKVRADLEKSKVISLIKQQLIKVKLSTQAFNKKMLEVGLLTEKERSGTKGAIKRFKVLTDLAYGKNVVSLQKPP